MKRTAGRNYRDDQGSLVLALLAILILTSVATVGLAAVVNGQHRTRNDSAYAKALNNAESGLDSAVALIKNNLTTTNSSFPVSGPGFSGMATEVFNSSYPKKDTTGEVTARAFDLEVTGTGETGGNTLHRTVQERVVITSVYDVPMYAKNDLQLNGDTGVLNYDPSGNSLGQTTPLTVVPLSNTPSINIAEPLAGTPGGAASGQTIEVTSADLSGFSQIGQVDATKACTQDGGACTSNSIVKGSSPPITDPQDCSNLSGLKVDLPAPLPPLDLTKLPLAGAGIVLNADINDPLKTLTQGQGIISKVCTTLPVIIPTVGGTLSDAVLHDLLQNTGLGGLDDVLSALGLGNVNLGTLDVPLNFSQQTCQNKAAYANGPTDGTTWCANPPSSLVINAMPTCNNANPPVCTGPPIILGTSTTAPTVLSGLISDPAGTCQITGNVILYGTINCAKIIVPAGSSLKVFYDMDLSKNDATYTSNLSNWREIT